MSRLRIGQWCSAAHYRRRASACALFIEGSVYGGGAYVTAADSQLRQQQRPLQFLPDKRVSAASACSLSPNSADNGASIATVLIVTVGADVRTSSRVVQSSSTAERERRYFKKTILRDSCRSEC
jgi:hypothetical protein